MSVLRQPFFPILPDYMSWEDWNGELAIYYGETNVAFHPEIDWKLTADNVTQSPFFSRFPVPDPETFETWQDWAGEFTLIINNPGR